MIHRKLKILIEKEQYTIGKTNAVPPNDICFGGRDMLPHHAVLSRIESKVFLKPRFSNAHLYVNGKRLTEPIELMNLDRVIFGWNSVYIFKNKEQVRDNETIKDRSLTWEFCKSEAAEVVDIDQSDDEEGPSGDSCC